MPIQKAYCKPGGMPIKIWTNDVEIEALQQLDNLSLLPFIHKHIAVMPDVHAGIGSTVGSVIATRGAIIPAAVGVDIGCGMMALKTDVKGAELPDDLHVLRGLIEDNIPIGRTDHGGRNDKGGWSGHRCAPPRMWNDSWQALVNDARWLRFNERHPSAIGINTNTFNHLGTLGTGNHFIEVCLDELDNVWLLLHSGSRGVGNRIGTYFINLAREDMRKWFVNLPDDSLAYLPEGTDHFDDYIDAMSWAQDYAEENRIIMMNEVIAALEIYLGRGVDVSQLAVNCHHNYAAKENHFGANVWVTRKGAVRARTGDLGVIPGSMGARSYIVRGIGNADAFHSCSHGAGRRMSRTAARARFTAEDLAAATTGVECRKDIGVVDEIPAAYKSIDEVMENQTDLVEVVATLKQIVNVKG